MKKLLLAFALILIASASEARVFNIGGESFASYLMFNGASSNLGQTPFKGDSSTTATYDDDYKYDYGGEFGFLYASPAVNFRFGLEIIKPQSLNAVSASNGGSTLYYIKNDITGIAPKFGIEFNLHRTPTSRVFLLTSAAQASVTLKNEYTLTSAGQTAFPAVSNHTVEAKGNATELELALGYEMFMADTTTIIFQASYKTLKFSQLKYSKDVTTFSGAQTTGSVVQDASSTDRSLDFTGANVSIGFRFYL